MFEKIIRGKAQDRFASFFKPLHTELFRVLAGMSSSERGISSHPSTPGVAPCLSRGADSWGQFVRFTKHAADVPLLDGATPVRLIISGASGADTFDYSWSSLKESLNQNIHDPLWIRLVSPSPEGMISLCVKAEPYNGGTEYRYHDFSCEHSDFIFVEINNQQICALVQFPGESFDVAWWKDMSTRDLKNIIRHTEHMLSAARSAAGKIPSSPSNPLDTTFGERLRNLANGG